jgi:hypothetical protein
MHHFGGLVGSVLGVATNKNESNNQTTNSQTILRERVLILSQMTAHLKDGWVSKDSLCHHRATQLPSFNKQTKTTKAKTEQITVTFKQ